MDPAAGTGLGRFEMGSAGRRYSHQVGAGLVQHLLVVCKPGAAEVSGELPTFLLTAATTGDEFQVVQIRNRSGMNVRDGSDSDDGCSIVALHEILTDLGLRPCSLQ